MYNLSFESLSRSVHCTRPKLTSTRPDGHKKTFIGGQPTAGAQPGHRSLQPGHVPPQWRHHCTNTLHCNPNYRCNCGCMNSPKAEMSRHPPICFRKVITVAVSNQTEATEQLKRMRWHSPGGSTGTLRIDRSWKRFSRSPVTGQRFTVGSRVKT